MDNNKKLAEEKLKYLFSESSLGIFFYDHKGNITSINKEVKKIISSFEKGKNIYEFIPNKNFIKEINNSYEEGEGYFEGSLEIKEKNILKLLLKV